MTKSKKIENLDFAETIKMIKQTLNLRDTRLIICTSQIIYLQIFEKREITAEMHNSTVKGHKDKTEVARNTVRKISKQIYRYSYNVVKIVS